MPCSGPFHFLTLLIMSDCCPLPDPDVGPSVFVSDVEYK